MGQRDDMQDMRSEIRQLRARIQQRPVITTTPFASKFYLLVMGDGNTVATYGAVDYYGLKYNTISAPTTVPTQIPSTTPGALADNLSWATLYLENGTISRVWVGVRLQPDGIGSVQADLLSIIPRDTTIVAFRTVQMQVAATGVYVPVYIPGRVA